MKYLQAALAGVLLAVTSTAALAAATGNGWLDGPWRFRALGYGWAPEAPATIKLDQQEVANLPENLDTILDGLDMAAMLEFEAHKGRLGFFLSPVYYKGRVSEHFKGPTGQNRKLTVKEEVWLVDYGVGWDLGPWELGTQAAPVLTLTPFVGARYFHDPIEMKVAPGELDKGLDEKITVRFNTPFVGAKAAVKLSDQWGFAVEADHGVFDSTKVNKTWQTMGAVNYNFKMGDLASRVVVGYRYLSLDLKNHPIEVKVDIKGPFVGFGVDF